MGDFISKLTSFDTLIGERLVKIVYFIGLVVIALSFVVGLFGAFATLQYSFLGFLGQLIMVPIIALLSVLFWRFICEIYILFFSLHNKVTRITDIAERNDHTARPDPGV